MKTGEILFDSLWSPPSDVSNCAFCFKAAALMPSDEKMIAVMQPSALFAREQSAGGRGKLADVGVIWDRWLLPRPTRQCFRVKSLVLVLSRCQAGTHTNKLTPKLPERHQASGFVISCCGFVVFLEKREKQLWYCIAITYCILSLCCTEDIMKLSLLQELQIHYLALMTETLWCSFSLLAVVPASEKSLHLCYCLVADSSKLAFN